MKQFTPKRLTQAVTVAMFTLMANSVIADPNTATATANPETSSAPSYKTIGDLEIYTKPDKGAASVFMMLDMSGSMNYIDIPQEMQSRVRSTGGGKRYACLV